MDSSMTSANSTRRSAMDSDEESGLDSGMGSETDGEQQEVLTGAARAAQRYIMQRRSIHLKKKQKKEAEAEKVRNGGGVTPKSEAQSLMPSAAPSATHSMMAPCKPTQWS